LFEYNHEEANMQYTKPVVDLRLAIKNWNYLTKGMSNAELKDFEQARDQLEQYDKLYTLIEYCSKLHEGVTCLEKKIASNNPTIPMNMYRQSAANNQESLFAEMEQYMQAYYDLLDDCKDHPLWVRKLQEDLGNSISFLGIQMEEELRNNLVKS
jgi:hypothetical protein